MNILDFNDTGREKRDVRYNSDIVMMLAATHHLLLTQKIRLDVLVDIIAEYVGKYLIIEFMPLGMWDGGDEKKAVVPKWYTMEWFVKGLENKFHVISIEKIRVNRTAIIAKKKGI